MLLGSVICFYPPNKNHPTHPPFNNRIMSAATCGPGTCGRVRTRRQRLRERRRAEAQNGLHSKSGQGPSPPAVPATEYNTWLQAGTGHQTTANRTGGIRAPVAQGHMRTGGDNGTGPSMVKKNKLHISTKPLLLTKRCLCSARALLALYPSLHSACALPELRLRMCACTYACSCVCIFGCL